MRAQALLLHHVEIEQTAQQKAESEDDGTTNQGGTGTGYKSSTHERMDKLSVFLFFVDAGELTKRLGGRAERRHTQFTARRRRTTAKT